MLECPLLVGRVIVLRHALGQKMTGAPDHHVTSPESMCVLCRSWGPGNTAAMACPSEGFSATKTHRSRLDLRLQGRPIGWPAICPHRPCCLVALHPDPDLPVFGVLQPQLPCGHQWRVSPTLRVRVNILFLPSSISRHQFQGLAVTRGCQLPMEFFQRTDHRLRVNVIAQQTLYLVSTPAG